MRKPLIYLALTVNNRNITMFLKLLRLVNKNKVRFNISLTNTRFYLKNEGFLKIGFSKK